MRCGTTGKPFVRIAVPSKVRPLRLRGHRRARHRSRAWFEMVPRKRNPVGCRRRLDQVPRREDIARAPGAALDSPVMDEPLRDNQVLWDAWTKIHVPSAFYDVASFRDGTRPIRLVDYELQEIGPVEGR